MDAPLVDAEWAIPAVDRAGRAYFVQLDEISTAITKSKSKASVKAKVRAQLRDEIKSLCEQGRELFGFDGDVND